MRVWEGKGRGRDDGSMGKENMGRRERKGHETWQRERGGCAPFLVMPREGSAYPA